MVRRLALVTLVSQGFPPSSASKESTCNAGDLGSIPGLGGSPGGGHGNPHQYSCLENPHGQRSLASHSPWGCKESDVTEQLSTLVISILNPTYVNHLILIEMLSNCSRLKWENVYIILMK